MIKYLLYAAAFFFTYFISSVLTPWFIGLAFKTNLLDHPAGRKQHKKPTPFFGGVIIFISFWMVTIGAFVFALMMGGHLKDIHQVPYILKDILPWLPRISGVFFGSLLVLVLGLWDDRYDLPPLVKFLGQSAAALLLLLTGLQVNLAFQLGGFGYFITFTWIVLVMNAFNFIDSIDGHCSGIALISTFMFFCLTQLVEQSAVSLFVMAFLGAVFGFFKYNVKPARCFLGDNGSLFIGYMLAVITLLCRYNAQPGTPLSLLIPILMFGVPIYDTLSVVAVRIIRGIPPWKGDRNHFAHRLVRLGMGERNASVFSYFIALTLGFVALLTTQTTTFLGNLLIALIFLSIISIVALLEYYVTVRISVMQQFAQRKHRRKSDAQTHENGADA